MTLAELIPDLPERLFTDLVALVPHDHVVSYSANHMNRSEELFFMMPNIETLCLSEVKVSKGFLRPNLDGLRANKKLLPLLRSLQLEDVALENGDWGDLTAYLVHQTSNNQITSLKVLSDPLMSPVVDKIKGLIEEFAYEYYE